MRTLLVLALCLVACGPNYREIQKADTIEGYESFLAEVSENHPDYWKAVLRLEEKYLDKAREMKSLEGYDLYLSKYQGVDNAKLVAIALEEREEFLYTWAQQENTVAGWEKFLEEYPRAKKKRKQEARRRIKVIDYGPNIGQGEVTLDRINLAEDPEGPMNGWGITCPFENKGDATIEYLNVQIEWLNDAGKVIQTKNWPLVAPKYPVPIEEEYLVPIEAGETRDFYYMAEELDGWAQKIVLTPVALRLQGEDSTEE